MLPMKEDLQELMITDGELEKILEINNLRWEYQLMPIIPREPEQILTFLVTIVIWSFLGYQLLPMIYHLIIVGLGQDNIHIAVEKIFPGQTAEETHIITSILFGILMVIYTVGTAFKEAKTKRILWSEVKKHNLIINNLHTLDQLQAVGNPVKINDRVKVIQALRITKEGLVRAFKTEKILLSNPNFKPECFNIDLTSLQAERTMVKAVEYAQLLDDAVQIGVSVQTEMRKLQNKSLNVKSF